MIQFGFAIWGVSSYLCGVAVVLGLGRHGNPIRKGSRSMALALALFALHTKLMVLIFTQN